MYTITIMTSITSSLIAMVKMFAAVLVASGDVQGRLAYRVDFALPYKKGKLYRQGSHGLPLQPMLSCISDISVFQTGNRTVIDVPKAGTISTNGFAPFAHRE